MRNTITPWLLASRPKTLTAAFVPVFVATMLAKHDSGTFDLSLSLYAFLAAIFVQMGTNLINDAYDFKKGADTENRLGPVRVTQSGLLSYEQVLAGGMICFGLSLLFGIPLMIQGGWVLTMILLLSVLCGYLYTGGPTPLAYSGLGDLFVLIFFGFVATCAVYYLQTGFLTIQSLIAAAQVGFLATVMIAINNMRDIVGDKVAKKRTMAVRFGITFARWEVTALIVTAFTLNVYWVMRNEPLAALLPFAVLPLGTLLIRGVWAQQPGRVYNRFLGLAALLQIAFGTLLGFGFMFS